MKKFISAFTAAVMILGTVSLPCVAAGETDSVERVFYENFETMTSENMGGITTTDEGENVITFESVDDITYSRVIKLTTTANYKNIKANFAQVLSFATTDIGANAYVEIEFDAKTNSSNLVVRPWGNSKKLQEYQIKSNKFYLNSSGTATGYSIPDTEKTTVWNRYKLVLQLTDSEGNSVQKLVGMYINGTSLGAVPEAEQGFLNSPTSFTGLVFEVKTAGEYAQVDNISVTKYNSADGTSKAPDRYALIKAVKAAKTKLTENEASLDAAKVAEISAKIDTALAAYNSAGCIADTANTQKNIMNAIPEEIDAIISGGSGGDDGSGNEDGGEDNEETGGSNILFSTFENGNTDMIFIQTQPDSETENLMEITSDSENSDFLIGNYLQFSYKNNAAYPTFNATFDKISYSDESLGANCFVDTEFDLKYSNTENKNIIFRFITKEGTSKSSRIGMTLGDSSVKIKDETEEGNPEIGSCPDISDWVRFRFVMQLTDENSAPVKKITAIYADEVNVMTCDPMALKGDDYGKFAIQLPKLGDMSVCIDNFSVTKYNVSAEAEYVSRSTLGAALRSFNTKLETGKKDGKYLNEYDTLKGKINTVASALLSVGTTLEQIASYYAEIEMLEQRLSAIDLMNKTNSSACITRLKISEASLSEKDNVSIEGTIFTNNETPLAATYAAVLFMKDEGFSGGKVCEIKSKEISLSAGNGTKESLSFDLSSYSEEEKEKMFIKAFVLKNNNIIEGGSAAFFGKNEEFYYTNAQTNDGVNASVIFTGENAQKIIIKTKAKANEKLFINVQSVQVLAESEEAVSPFVYINYVNADENGLVTVEFTPQSGVRSYNYSVIGTYTDASGSINCYSYQETQDAFNRLYAEKTAARLESEKDILQVNTTVYSLAKGSGVNITNILKGVLEEETYSPITLNKFAGSILGKLDLIYKVRNATSTDILTQALTPNLSLLENGSSYSALLSGKKQTALTKLLAKKSEVVDLNSLDTALKNAVDEANKSTTSSETSDRDYGGGGGGYAASMKFVTEVATQKETIMTAGISFDDIADVTWAYEAIAAFSGMNVINGKSETKFVPNDNITREEFVKIAVKAFALPERTDAAAFNDVEKDSWYALPISSAVNAGIVNGMEDGSFGVGRAISREDMAVIIHRLLRYVGKGITEDGIYIEFTDEYQASEYAKQAIIDLAKSGIVNGMGDNAFMPKANCTRAQATKMLYEAYRRIQ